MQTFLNFWPEIITDTYGHEQFYIFFFNTYPSINHANFKRIRL